jgi:hypothetical protein
LTFEIKPLSLFYQLTIKLKSKKMATATLPKELTDKVLARVNEMKSDAQVQTIMMSFEKKEDAIDWLYKAAVATLFGV